MIPVRLRPEAEADLIDAMMWYEAHTPGLGEKFLVAVRAVLTRIREHPHSGQQLTNEARRVLIPPFPYSVVYVVGEDALVVVACFHFRRDPLSWRERLR